MLRQLRSGSPDASADLTALLDRSTRMAEGVDDAVAAILADVRARRDAAVADYTRRFDRREPVDGSYELSRARWDALAAAGRARRCATRSSSRRRGSARFTSASVEPDIDLTLDGVRLELRVTPLARVGLYVPGGTALLPVERADDRDPGEGRRRARGRDGDAGRVDRGAARGAARRASIACSSSAARRRSPRSRTAPRPCRGSTRSSARATRGSRRPSARSTARSTSTRSPARRRS